MITGGERGQLEDVVAMVRDVLGSDALGAYLHGSAVLGGLRARSDLDVLVISRRPTTLADKRRLADGMLATSGTGAPGDPRRPLELTIIEASQVRPWRYPPSFDFQYGNWLRPQFEAGDVEPWSTRVNPDLAPLLTAARDAGRPLFGRPAAELIDPIPLSDLRVGMRDEVDGLLADLAWDTRNVLLTLARMWSTAEAGAIRSKDDAADWAIARLPVGLRAALELARDAYRGSVHDAWEALLPQARATAEAIAAHVRSAVQPR